MSCEECRITQKAYVDGDDSLYLPIRIGTAEVFLVGCEKHTIAVQTLVQYSIAAFPPEPGMWTDEQMAETKVWFRHVMDQIEQKVKADRPEPWSSDVMRLSNTGWQTFQELERMRERVFKQADEGHLLEEAWANDTGAIYNAVGDEPHDMNWEEVVAYIKRVARPLFMHSPTKFKLHSGKESNFLIECETLTAEDWQALAYVASKVLKPFKEVEPVLTGGAKFARSLMQYRSEEGGLLIVDDLLTTGTSMEEQRNGREAQGVVAFARGGWPSWIVPLFVMSPEAAERV